MKPMRSFIFGSVASLLFFPVNLFAVHLLLRGHDAPGGGFIAGVGTALSLVLLALAFGVEGMQKVFRFDPVRIAAIGVMLAFVVSTIPLFRGWPFLQHHQLQIIAVPVIGDITIGSALLFDIGVYLLVVGGLTKLLIVLARSIARSGAFLPGEVRRYASVMEEPIEPIRALKQPPRDRASQQHRERHAD